MAQAATDTELENVGLDVPSTANHHETSSGANASSTPRTNHANTAFDEAEPPEGKTISLRGTAFNLANSTIGAGTNLSRDHLLFDTFVAV
eukprot:TRINITY_DN1045_c0_g1_i3.p1 TRINITY_DN1045_c0_g1~~TRINITY_DN1045_c0_g1_i3.p1  ORF type:complete len:101 (+),score=17.29 TRINITY_DN1045_c0_g1_i3:35-304(+)